MGKKVLIIGGYSPLTAASLNGYGAGAGVNPYLLFPSFQNSKTKRVSVPLLGAIAIGTFLKEKGIDVEVIDYFTNDQKITSADIIGISTTFFTIEIVKEIVKEIHQVNKNALIVLGGPLSWSVQPEKLLFEIPRIDIIVFREGEETFLEIVKTYSAGISFENIAGIVYTKHGTVFKTPSRELLEIDKIPKPDWNLVGFESRLRVLPVETGRGCLYNCAFCNEVGYWGKPVRFKKIEKVIDELLYNTLKIGIDTFRFVDSCFTAPEERCGLLCDAIYENLIKKGVKIKWSSYARANNLSAGLLTKMSRAGCIALDVGWESGDEGILKNMNKTYNPRSIIESMRVASELGVLVHCNTLIGFPGETIETINNTIKILEEAKPNSYQCLYLYVSPNSFLYENANAFNLEGHGHTWKHNTMNSEQAEKAIAYITKSLPQLTMFAGGEFFSCYLASLNLPINEIKEFFRAINRVGNGEKRESDLELIKKIDTSLTGYW